MKASTTEPSRRAAPRDASTTAKALLTLASVGATLLGWLSLGAGEAPKTGAVDARRPGTTPSLPPLPTLASVPTPEVRFVPPWQRAAGRPKPVAATRSSR